MSIIGPVPLNVDSSDLFYFLEDLDILRYVDDAATYAVKENKDSVNDKLEASPSSIVFNRFDTNFMKTSSCGLRLGCSKTSTTVTDDSSIQLNINEVLFGKTITKKL